VPRAAPAAGRPPGGFTFLEVMVALMITSLACLACIQVFAYGAMQLERLGYRRQALALLDGEMEYWRARFQRAGSGAEVSPAEAGDRRRELKMDPAFGPTFVVESAVDPVRREGDLHLQRVRVQVSYRRLDATDTLVLEGRHYVR
jgi:prepilin-type N-terminal cleavage/methylation domain-containing protein